MMMMMMIPARRCASAGTSYVCVYVCLSVCLSVTIGVFFETAGGIELVFGMGASFYLSYTVLLGNSCISKNKCTSLWNFVLNSILEKNLLRHIDHRNVLST